MSDVTLKITPLHAEHLALGARMMPFAGFDMPVHYGSIIDEHLAVRHAAGLFDVSHMGEIMVRGARALEFLQHLVSNDVSKLVDGQAQYTVMCHPDGGIVDDLLVYRLGDREYMLVVNASGIETDEAWMRENNPMRAELENTSGATALIAVQGPKAFDIVSRLAGGPLEIPYYHFHVATPSSFLGCRAAILSHTGYTGERGLEIYCEPDRAPHVWSTILGEGAADGLRPAGLGARDTLRLEAGYCLYGSDITTETNPLEAGLGWLTRLEKPFIGRDTLLRIKAEGPKRRLVAFVMEDRAIPRHGQEITDVEGRPVGVVTSGTQSPVVGRGIGMGYVPNDPAFTAQGSGIHILIRGRSTRATVRKAPLHKSA